MLSIIFLVSIFVGAFCFITAHGTAFLITLICKIFLLKYSTALTLAQITFFPFKIVSFSLTISSFLTAYHSRLVLEIKNLRISFHWRDWISTLLSIRPSKLIHIVLEGLDLSVHEISLDDVLTPPQSTSINSATKARNVSNIRKKSMSRWFMKLLHIEFRESVTIEVNLPKETAVIRLAADQASIVIFPNLEDTEVLELQLQAQSHLLEIHHDGLSALKVTGATVAITVKQNQYTSFIQICASYVGEGRTLAVANVQPLLSFYRIFQTAEDEATDVKIVRGQDTSGKMRLIR